MPYFSNVQMLFSDGVEVDLGILNRTERLTHVANEVWVDVVVQIRKRHFFRKNGTDVVDIELKQAQI